jgi:hypothetical protein
MDRRHLMLSLSALGASLISGNALAQVSDTPVVGITGTLNARTISRFTAEINKNIGKVISLDISGNEADEGGGTFDIGEGQGSELSIEHRTSQLATIMRVDGAFRKSGNNPIRYTVSGQYVPRLGRSGPNPRYRNIFLERWQPTGAAGGTYPTIRL